MRYFLDPFGCVKNQVDAENMMAHLNNAGWENTPDVELADLIIVNSCGFIKSAKQESINAVLEWRKFYPDKKILLAGCLTQRYTKELSVSLNEADGFFGVENIPGIVQTVSKIMQITENHKTKTLTNQHLQQGNRPLLSLPGSAYVKISEGCNNHCSYCAIPLIRGNLVSRSVPDILKECQTLLNRGISELCLIAQDTGSYGKDINSKTASLLPELLDKISGLKGHFWVRLLYIHPDNFPLQILDIMERNPRFLPYFDIPFQHSSPKILTAMNRHGNTEKYLKLLDNIRSRLPHAVIRSTFLLGFPGETDEDFSALLDFQEKATLDWLGCFVYSREEGTAAYPMKGRVAKKIALIRKQTIEERQIPITEKNIDRFIGQTLEILIEELIHSPDTTAGKVESLTPESFAIGRLYCHAPDIDGAAVITGKSPPAGALVSCKVKTRRGIDLEVSPVPCL